MQKLVKKFNPDKSSLNTFFGTFGKLEMHGFS